MDGYTLQTTLLMMMFSDQRLRQPLEVASEWGLASTAIRRRLVFVRRGASAIWTTVAMLALRAASRTMGRVPRAGPVPWEHLVQRVKDGVNCGARGAVSPFYSVYLICK